LDAGQERALGVEEVEEDEDVVDPEEPEGDVPVVALWL
jgi:hypothetical protein